MSTGGGGIPRLQELSYLEVAARAVDKGSSFDEIRRQMVVHMLAIGVASPGTGNTAAYRNAKENPTRYVSNVSEALKELMRLGLVQKATLPSSSASAHAHRSTTYGLTDEGSGWVKLLREDRHRGYDVLCNILLQHHPQFAGFLRTIGAFSDPAGQSFMIPLKRWGDVPKPRDRDRYIRTLAVHISAELSTQDAGWKADHQEVVAWVNSYVRDILVRASSRQRRDPLQRNQDFANACEQAAVKLAFTKAGAPLDYISMEILRRWTRTLGLASFSYHAPGEYALRFWPTADLRQSGDGLQIDRRSWRAMARPNHR